MLWRGPMGGGAASGKIGAMIAGHCAQGQYLKSRVKPVNPRSTFQHPLRNAMRQLAVQYGTILTSTQRAAWATYAANVTWVNRLGDTVHLSGQMEFIRSNLTLQLAGLPFVLDAPTTFDRGDVGGAPTLTLAPGGALFTLTLNASSPWLSGNVLDGLMVYLSLPRSGAISFFKRRSRFIDRIPGTAAGSIHVFGFTQWPVPDFRQAWQVWVAAQFADGRLTTPVPTNAVLTGPPPPPFWLEPFTYPDGNLWGNDGWTDPGSGGGTPAIVSDTAQAGTTGDYAATVTAPGIPTDWGMPWEFEADYIISGGSISDQQSLQFAFGDNTGNTGTCSALFTANFTRTSGSSANAAAFDIFDQHSHDVFAINVPVTTDAPHTLRIVYNGSTVEIFNDGVSLASGILTPDPGVPASLTWLDAAGPTSVTLILDRLFAQAP